MDRSPDRNIAIAATPGNADRTKTMTLHCSWLSPCSSLSQHPLPAPQHSTHLDVVLEIVVGSLAAAQQVTGVEGIVHVPADATGGPRQIAHAKLLALEHGGVEVAERKDDGAVLGLLGARLKDLLREEVVGAAQVGLEALRGLVGQLDGVLRVKRQSKQNQKNCVFWGSQ